MTVRKFTVTCETINSEHAVLWIKHGNVVIRCLETPYDDISCWGMVYPPIDPLFFSRDVNKKKREKRQNVLKDVNGKRITKEDRVEPGIYTCTSIRYTDFEASFFGCCTCDEPESCRFCLTAKSVVQTLVHFKQIGISKDVRCLLFQSFRRIYNDRNNYKWMRRISFIVDTKQTLTKNKAELKKVSKKLKRGKLSKLKRAKLKAKKHKLIYKILKDKQTLKESKF